MNRDDMENSWVSDAQLHTPPPDNTKQQVTGAAAVARAQS